MNRRNFIWSSVKALTGLGFLPFVNCGKDDPQGLVDDNAVMPLRQSVQNPYVSGGNPILVSVSGGSSFEERLDAGLAEIGGLEPLLYQSSSVLVKPNLNAVDTYPAISSADSLSYLVRKAVEAAPSTVYVGDASWQDPVDVYAHVGLENAVGPEGGEVIHFSEYRRVRAPHWDSSRSDSHVHRQVYDVSAIINFACLKRHFFAVMTCAMKNNVGTIAATGGTDDRAAFHALYGDAVLREIAEIANLVRPELNIIDAASALTVSGPMTSQGVVVHDIDMLIICGDIVATDLYCANLLAQHDSTFTADMVQVTLDHAAELGLGENSLANVDVREVSI